MDSRKNNEASERRREEALARRMGEALDRLTPRNTGECPDAGILAAYHEHAIDPVETEQWENHFAGCARCRKILAVLAASVEEPLSDNEVARLGELVAAAAQPAQPAPAQKATPIRPSRWDWRARWLAPALGVAAVLAMWLAVRPPWRAGNGGSAQTLIAQAPANHTNEVAPNAEPKALDQFSKAEPSQERKTEAAAPPATPRDLSAAGGSSPGLSGKAPEERKGDRKDLSPAPPAVPSRAGDAINVPVSPQAKSLAAPVAAGITSTADKATAATGNASLQAGQAPAPAPSDSVMRAGQAFPKTSARAQSLQRFGVMETKQASPAVLLKAPSGRNIWRAGKGGNIERSTDAGRTWTAQASPVREDWLAGAAVSGTAAWLVGRNGAIARTLDGEHWERVAPPPQAAGSAAKSPDWTGITVQGPQAATITARDGRRFVTQDGGKTWQAR
ncbi:MAG TPA: hypothetical protein VNI36_12430 [Candidatus Dormibacteraeota bacterium]|nr:hypothetical protein [Candidatus Dormibacteraeota bacterium]